MESISWNFPGSRTSSRSTHGLFDARSIHWYPATYIPEIPYSLIELLSKPGDSVADPFAGTGTTLWQAQALGRHPYGSELTLVGQNICADVWSLLSPDADLGSAQEQVLALLRVWDGVDLSGVFRSSVRGSLLEPWFSEGTFRELAFIASAEEMVSATAFHLLRLATSAILASVSEQRRGWGCIADNMVPRPDALKAAPSSRSAIDKVRQKTKSIVRAVAAAREARALLGYDAIVDDPATHLFAGDCLESGIFDQEGAYDLVVTSPPYPAMTDYSTAQRLSYYWHGILPERDVPKEIGARRRRFGGGYLNDYVQEMTLAFDAIGRSVKVGGYVAMVVPAFSTPEEGDARATALSAVFESASDHSLQLAWETDRILPSSRRHINQKWTSLKRENIRVYERVR